MMISQNEVFIEKRKLTIVEFFMTTILEDMACHGIFEEIKGYSIDLVYLGRKGNFRILKNGKEQVLVGRRYPPRVREIKRYIIEY
jgi:hypothetical protein